MNRKLIFVLLIAILPFTVDAQFNGILNKVKNKTKQRTDNKIDKEIDKTLDEIEGKQKPEPVSAASTTTQQTKAEIKTEEPALKSYTKYDFIPGEQILYYDNFEGEALAELPTAWNTSCTGEVTTFDNYPGNWLRLHKPFTYLSSNKKEFGENYTVEFDVILNLKNNGWMYPEFYFACLLQKTKPAMVMIS
jgi:OmpA-OmpF porin, OOP family